MFIPLLPPRKRLSASLLVFGLLLTSAGAVTVLVYPVISMKKDITNTRTEGALLGPNPDPSLVDFLSNETQVTAQTPPTLLVRAADDTTVLPANCDLMLAALKKMGIPCALQEYPKGGHGFGYGGPGVSGRSPPDWLDAVGKWLNDHSLIAIPTGSP